MRIKTSHVFWGLTIVMALLNSPGLTQKYEASLALKAKRQEAGIKRQADIGDAKLLQARSAVALERVKAGCIIVSAGAENVPLVNGATVGSPDGSPLTADAIVCNSRGDTASIEIVPVPDDSSPTGERDVSVLGDLATASGKDLTVYERRYQRLLKNVQTGGVPPSDVKAQEQQALKGASEQ